MSNALIVSNCVGFNDYNRANPPSSYSATAGTNTLTFAQAFSSPQEWFDWSSLNLTNGETLTLTFSGTHAGAPDPGDPFAVGLFIYDCAGTALFNDFNLNNTSGTITYTVPAEGEYWVRVGFFGGFSTAPWTAGAAVLSATTLTVNPVIALWDDSGTTRQLEACPKMLLPPLTESTGDWYADCASAATVMADPLQVGNCLGYATGGPGMSSFGVVDGGTSVIISVGGSMGVGTWVSVNLEAGKTLTVTGAATSGVVTITAEIYDYNGTLLESSGIAVSSPWTSSALPYIGRYIIFCVVQSTVAGADTTNTLTSSGTISANPIQSLYDVGLTCPARLNCGDSCP